MTLQNDRLIRALLRQPVDVTPVWLMRQAGRYLPEYRAIRSQAKDFLTLCKTPELACEVTLQPLRRFALDAAIIFSDILTIPDAMGLELYFSEGEGPRFQKPIRDVKDITALPITDITSRLHYVFSAIRLVKKELAGKVPLIGFAGSPWTVATYMIEGGSSKNFSKAKRWLFDDPTSMHQLLGKITDATVAYLNAQIAAGVDVVMIFDTWGGILTPRDYEEFSLRYMTNIVVQLNRFLEDRRVPVIVFTKNGGQWLEAIAKSECDAIGIDWTTNMNDARRRVGDRVALQGNMDPGILYAAPEKIRREVEIILKSYGNGSGHIFNLGHGIYPDVPPEHVQIFVDAVHEFSPVFHKVNL